MVEEISISISISNISSHHSLTQSFSKTHHSRTLFPSLFSISNQTKKPHQQIKSKTKPHGMFLAYTSIYPTPPQYPIIIYDEKNSSTTRGITVVRITSTCEDSKLAKEEKRLRKHSWVFVALINIHCVSFWETKLRGNSLVLLNETKLQKWGRVSPLSFS